MAVMSESEDPARGFLDQTVPKHDEWDGREPDDGPARPRHVQHPEPVETFGAKQRRATTIRNVAWGAASLGAFGAGAALTDDTEPPEMDAGFGDAGSGL
jgi:hypothetical protein